MGLISLKSKMTLVVSLLMGGMLTTLALLGFRYFENQFRETVERHQFAMALMKKADVAMYQSKAEGKSRFRLYSERAANVARQSDKDSADLIPSGRERRP